MLQYNLYYNNEKINKRPISKTELDKVRSSKIISKYDKASNEVKKIPTDEIEIITCYVV